MRSWLIEEWCEAWRFSSLWVATAGFGVLAVWNQMPGVVRARVPDWLELSIGLALWAAVLLARITRQPSSQAKIDAKRSAAAPDDYSQWSDRAHG